MILFFILGTQYEQKISYGDSDDEIEFNSPTLTNSNLKIELLLTGLNSPTQLTFVDDETILVTEKESGRIVMIKNFTFQGPIEDLNVDSFQGRGLIGLESSKSQNQTFVFVYYTESSIEEDTEMPEESNMPINTDDNNGNKLVKYSWNGTSLIDPDIILYPFTYAARSHHGGGITTLDEDLFLVVGDNKNFTGFLSNNPDDDIFNVGVVFRINFDGIASNSNPFSEDRLKKYFAYGIRNSFGISIDPLTNNVWMTENGPDQFDEVNLVFPGFNSGWMKIQGPNGQGRFSSELADLTQLEGSQYSDPEFSWYNTVAPTEIEFLESKKLGKEFQYDAFVGSVRGSLYHFELNQNREGFSFSDIQLADLVANNPEEEASIIFGKNLGVIVDVETGPDGYLYVLSMNVWNRDKWDELKSENQYIEPVKDGGKGILFRIVPKQFTQTLDDNILPPSQQLKNRINPAEVECKSNFALVYKALNDKPLCITPETAQKLFSRGWIKSNINN